MTSIELRVPCQRPGCGRLVHVRVTFPANRTALPNFAPAAHDCKEAK